MIQSGHYTHAADVWSFGVLSWELYIAATAGQAATADDILPYKDISDDEVGFAIYTLQRALFAFV